MEEIVRKLPTVICTCNKTELARLKDPSWRRSEVKGPGVMENWLWVEQKELPKRRKGA